MQTVALSPASAPAHRLVETVVTVTDASGAPLPDAEITVAQTSHAFAFGNIGFDFVGGSSTAVWRSGGAASAAFTVSAAQRDVTIGVARA